ncbi:MAG: hypothetical protein ACE15C_19800 [Phycisphaerae bacterium]
MSWRSKSYEVLPALSVRRAELRRSLRIATVSWLFGSAWAVLVSGIQLKSFARMLGFSDELFGWLAAAPAAATIAMVVGAELIERSGLRKYQFLYSGITHRLLWVAIAMIPLVVFVPSTVAVSLMLGIYTLSWLLQSFANPAWTTWMGDLVPRRIRGRFFAARFGFGRIVQVLIVVGIGILLDYVTVSTLDPHVLADKLVAAARAEGLPASEIASISRSWDMEKDKLQSDISETDLDSRRIEIRSLSVEQAALRAGLRPATIAKVRAASFTKSQPEAASRQPMLLWVICAIFGIGAIIGAAEIWMYRNVREIVQPKPDKAAAPKIFTEGSWTNLILLICAAVIAGVAAITDLAPDYRLWAKGAFFLLVIASVVVLASRIKEHALKRYVAYGMTIGFAIAVPGFFFIVYTSEYLGFSKLAVQVLYMVISPILGMIGLRVWGRLLDRWGRRPVLMAATFMTVFSVMPYFFSTPHTPWPEFITTATNWIAGKAGPLIGRPGWVWITPDMPVGAYLVVSCSILIGGIGWTGVMMGQGNILLGFSDRQGRSRYVAAAQVIISLGSVAGAPIGGFIVSLINDVKVLGFTELHVGPFIWTAYHATFALSGLARFAALLWLIGMPDPGSGKMRDMVRAIGAVAYNNISTLVLYPFRVFSRGPREDRNGGGSQ